MDSYIPGQLNKDFLEQREKELAWSNWVRKHWNYQEIKNESCSSNTSRG